MRLINFCENMHQLQSALLVLVSKAGGYNSPTTLLHISIYVSLISGKVDRMSSTETVAEIRFPDGSNQRL